MTVCSLWVEKYRPKSFDDLADQQTAVQMLKSFIETGSVPHMILRGPAGTGKTSAAHIFVRSLFPPELMGDRVLELNASEERGIRTVRGKIKRFVSARVPVIKGVPAISIVILDEADALTLDSQYALRRVMEDSSKNSRFILVCNYINRIIPPLMSRCVIIHFNTLDKSSIRSILEKVCNEEEIPDSLRKKAIEQGQKRDARKAINHLQRMMTGVVSAEDMQVDWPSLMVKPPTALFNAVNDLLLDGNDIDSLIENFVAWAMRSHPTPPAFLDKAVRVCCNVANHGTPIIQLTSLILSYRQIVEE